jgi:hypothetical protein
MYSIINANQYCDFGTAGILLPLFYTTVKLLAYVNIHFTIINIFLPILDVWLPFTNNLLQNCISLQ